MAEIIYSLHQAKAFLSQLVDRAANGEEIILSKAGKPLAKLAVQVMLFSGDLKAVLDHAEGVVDLLGDGHWRSDVDVAAVCGLFAAVWLYYFH